MAAAGKRGREALRFVYLPRFGSHPCGGVLPRGARRAAEPRGAAGAGGDGALSPRARPAPPASPAGRARAGLSQKMLTKKFEFPIRSNETSKAMKKKKEVSVWKKVHKVISRMLEENEQYRLRLKCQGLSSENSDHKDESSHHLLYRLDSFGGRDSWMDHVTGSQPRDVF